MRKLYQSLLHSACAVTALVLMGVSSPALADISLADSPLFSSVSVPGNLALTLSVEWPTANTPAYKSSSNAYSASNTYLGYFDPAKCYLYNYNSTTPKYSYFSPNSLATSHACNSSNPPLWSGNYLNWASMQSLDVFRWALSGGTRVVDTATQTILEKTYNSGQAGSSVYPDTKISGSTLVQGATPFTWSEVDTSAQNYVQNTNYGTVMWVSGAANSNMSSATGTDYVGASTADSSKIYRVYIRVQVCSTGVSLESNCVQYGSNYKPEGLMQKYAMKLRYADFGYLNDSSNTRDGGVMRARMKYIGPLQPVPGSANITNTAAEWSSTDGTQYSNPDSSDASATTSRATSEGGFSVTVSNSGVLNYLNKFGKITPGNYKSKDPVGELYYAAVRYFKNLGNVASYSSLSGSGSQPSLSTWIDGFPVINTWDDPILYSCQKNFILGIGDVNTWYDGNVPGSTLRSTEPSIPSEVSADSTVNEKTATDMVGTLEGISNLGSTYVSSGRGDNYYMAGLAYDSHTKDIRSDLTGTQTINTYWMDVYENGYSSKNQFWLATKYGGFTVPSGFSTYSSSNGTSTIPLTAWHTTSDSVGSDYRPDNYFPANNPSAMTTGLDQAFSKIVSEAAAATSTTLANVSPKQATSGNANYMASYDPATWTGSLIGESVAFDANGNATYTDIWNLRSILASTSASSRKIVTCCTSAGAALPFEYSNLSAGGLSTRTYFTSFSNVPGVSASSQSASNYVSYLRGDQSKELSKTGGVYRTRSYLLGDIVDSKPVAVAAPSDNYTNLYNPGYTAFQSSYASRKTVVYVGSNDGMLHAVDGSVVSGGSGGTELFAYIPSFMYGDSTTAATSGLASLGNPTFTHHFMVDGRIDVFNVDFYNTKNHTATTNDWRTILVGGLGKGGKGYYAIDVTDPSAWTSETTVAGKVLWEFTDSSMGYSYGDPMVFKTKKYGWVAVFTSGYNNSDGIGYFYFVDPRTGTLLEKVATPEGSTTAPINLAFASAYSWNYADNTVDAIYGGDLQGNVWRLDVTASSGSYTSPTKLAKLTNSSGTAQPVTTNPLIEADSTGKKRYLVLGTGRLLADSDISSSDQQSIYVIADGTTDYGGFYTSSTLPSGATFPVTRSQLVANTDLTTGIGSSPAKVMGWYYDLNVTSGIAERINVDPTTVNSIAAFGINIPNGSVCSPSGTGRVVAFSIDTGKTVLTSGTSLVASISTTSVINGLVFVNVGGNVFLQAGTSDGQKVAVPGNFNALGTLKRMNWRMVPTAD